MPSSMAEQRIRGRATHRALARLRARHGREFARLFRVELVVARAEADAGLVPVSSQVPAVRETLGHRLAAG